MQQAHAQASGQASCVGSESSLLFCAPACHESCRAYLKTCENFFYCLKVLTDLTAGFAMGTPPKFVQVLRTTLRQGMNCIFPSLEAVTEENSGILCLKSKSGGPEPRSADCRLPAGFGRFGLRKGVQNFGRPVLVWYASALYGSFNVSFDSTGCWLTSSWS